MLYTDLQKGDVFEYTIDYINSINIRDPKRKEELLSAAFEIKNVNIHNNHIEILYYSFSSIEKMDITKDGRNAHNPRGPIMINIVSLAEEQ